MMPKLALDPRPARLWTLRQLTHVKLGSQM
jgi:hypothetical protein